LKVLDKSNEITAIPFLLDAFNGEDSIVTIDAMGTQKKIAAKINKQKGDYILSLKVNHPTLFNEVSDWFESLQSENTLPPPLEHTTEAGHHRIEIRKYWTFSLDQLPVLYQPDEWAGLQSIVVVERTRHLWKETTHEIQFYLSSLHYFTGNSFFKARCYSLIVKSI
jgi:UbiD family decarboxylase